MRMIFVRTYVGNIFIYSSSSSRGADSVEKAFKRLYKAEKALTLPYAKRGDKELLSTHRFKAFFPRKVYPQLIHRVINCLSP